MAIVEELLEMALAASSGRSPELSNKQLCREDAGRKYLAAIACAAEIECLRTL